MNHVLVTGAAGFIGAAVLPQLAADGWRITAVSRRAAPSFEAGQHVNWLTADLHDHEALRQLLAAHRPSHLLHLAWCTEHGRFWTADANLDWVVTSIELLRAFREAGGKHAVIAGTCAEYSWQHGYCREEVTPLEPSTLYGTSKNALRMLAEASCFTSGIQLAWGRIFSPYGPGEGAGRLVPSVVTSALSGQPVRCSTGEQYRDYLHVSDVASAFVALLRRDASGAFNIASGAPVRIRDIVTRLCEATGSRTQPLFGALPLRPDEPPLLVGDNTRLCALGWRPTVALEQGLCDTVTWWRNQLNCAGKNPT